MSNYKKFKNRSNLSHLALLLLVAMLGLLTVRALPSQSPIIAPGATLELLADGFKFTEGCASDAAGNVYFSDQPNDRIHVWSVDGKLSTFIQGSGRANGMSFDQDGDLYVCADENNELRRIPVSDNEFQRVNARGKPEVLVTKYNGKRLNGPNDVWIVPNRSGGLYFTDPFYKRDYWAHSSVGEQGVQAVYYLGPHFRELFRVVDDMKAPNGIIGTPDGRSLYIADIGANRTYRYDIQPTGSLSNKKLFCEMGSDGMTIDNEGNVYLTGMGVTVFNLEGIQIEKIAVPGWVGNVCFGGADRRTLFITASEKFYSLRMRVKGVGSQ